MAKLKVTNLTSLTDQLETFLINQAKLEGQYYNELLNNHVPTELAAALTLNYSNLFWEHSFNLKPNNDNNNEENK